VGVPIEDRVGLILAVGSRYGNIFRQERQLHLVVEAPRRESILFVVVLVLIAGPSASLNPVVTTR
jgi:hypothetical protein